MQSTRSSFLISSLSLLAACAAPVEPGAPAPAAPSSQSAAAGASAPAATPRASGPIYVPELLSSGLADPRAYALLSELCATAPHRLAGSQGAARAVEWGREAMQRLGLEHVRLEPCTVP